MLLDMQIRAQTVSHAPPMGKPATPYPNCLSTHHLYHQSDGRSAQFPHLPPSDSLNNSSADQEIRLGLRWSRAVLIRGMACALSAVLRKKRERESKPNGGTG